MWDALGQLAPAAAAVVVILYIVFKFIKDMTGQKQSQRPQLELVVTRDDINDIRHRLSQIEKDMEKVCNETHDLWQWHNKMDDDNVPIWWFKNSYRKALDAIGKHLEVNNEVMKKLTERIKALTIIAD